MSKFDPKIITPSARKSFRNTSNQYSNMVRYGINPIADSDEVDNVMSKYTRQPSPNISDLNERRKNRRGSHSPIDNQEFSNNSTDNLAKSLPAKLPSNFYRSFEDFNSTLMSNTSSSINISTQSNRSGERRSPNRSRERRSPNINIRNEYYKKEEESSLMLYFVLPFVLILVSIYYSVHILGNDHGNQSSPLNGESLFLSEIDNLRVLYKLKKDLILQVQTGISTINLRQDAGSFIFVYKNDETNSTEGQFNKFVKDMSKVAAKYLRNEHAEPTVIEGSTLDLETHSEMISKYRQGVEDTGVMVVKNVNDVPSALAMAFHYYCDEYNPLVKKSAIFFTLDITKCTDVVGQKVYHDTVEKCLEKKWKGLPPDNMKPLLTRVVDVIVDVTSTF